MELFFTVLASLLLTSLITLLGYLSYKWLTTSPYHNDRDTHFYWEQASSDQFMVSAKTENRRSRMFYILWNIRNYKELWFFVIESGLDTDHCEYLWSWSYDILGPSWTFKIFSHLVAILHLASEVPYSIRGEY